MEFRALGLGSDGQTRMCCFVQLFVLFTQFRFGMPVPSELKFGTERRRPGTRSLQCRSTQAMPLRVLSELEQTAALKAAKADLGYLLESADVPKEVQVAIYHAGFTSLGLFAS